MKTEEVIKQWKKSVIENIPELKNKLVYEAYKKRLEEAIKIVEPTLPLLITMAAYTQMCGTGLEDEHN